MSNPVMKSIKRIRIHVTREPVAEYHRICMHSFEVAEVARQLLGHEDQEVLLAFLLDVKNRIFGYVEVARGSTTECPVHPREVFRAAVLQSAVSIVLCHNHPSGDSTPSADDRNITHRLREAGAILGITLLDHVIVADGAAHFSFLDAGLLS